MSETQMKRDHNRYGFATIDVPYNFLVKSQYYRTVEGAGVGILQKAGLTLSQHLKMTQVLENWIEMRRKRIWKLYRKSCSY